MKKLKERFCKDNQMVQMTLQEYVDFLELNRIENHIKHDNLIELNAVEVDAASTIIAIEETKRIMREKYKTEISRSIAMI